MQQLEISLKDIQNKTHEKFRIDLIKQIGSSKDLTPEIVQVRFNHFQNRRKYLITKIADAINENQKNKYSKSKKQGV